MANNRNTPKLARRLACLLALATLAGCCGADEAACTQAQGEVLGAMIAGGVSGYRPYQPAPVFVSCTQTGRMVNCVGQ